MILLSVNSFVNDVLCNFNKLEQNANYLGSLNRRPLRFQTPHWMMKRTHEPEEIIEEQPVDPARSEAEFEEFSTVKKNKAATLAFLVNLSQRIEQTWPQQDERLRLLKIIRYLNLLY